MLFGNVNKLDLVPYISEEFIKLINEAVILSENNDVGKYVIGDDGVFVMLVDAETELREKRKSEIHKNYIDIQILLSGEETFGYSNDILDEAFNLVELENDVMFFDDVENEQFVSLQKNDFAIFYPCQAHRPLCATGDKPVKVKKAILKIPTSLL